VADAAGGFGLEEELLDAFGLLGKAIVQNLDGHRLLQHDVLGAVDHTHPALADHALDLVILKPHADAGNDLGREQGCAVFGAKSKRPGETSAALGANTDGAHIYCLCSAIPSPNVKTKKPPATRAWRQAAPCHEPQGLVVTLLASGDTIKLIA
jgi:hypothetical protein